MVIFCLKTPYQPTKSNHYVPNINRFNVKLRALPGHNTIKVLRNETKVVFVPLAKIPCDYRLGLDIIATGYTSGIQVEFKSIINSDIRVELPDTFIFISDN